MRPWCRSARSIRVQVTASDVIHSFTVPGFGVRIDAVPGRLNEAWFQAEREGIYYGQCSKICGKDHAFMPIVFRVVSEAQYADWLTQAKKKYAASRRPPSSPTPPLRPPPLTLPPRPPRPRQTRSRGSPECQP